MPALGLPPAKTVLLTGAGFSKPFGGFLGSEMWAVILTHPAIRENKKLREVMLKDTDYEALYEHIVRPENPSNYTREDQLGFMQAVQAAYECLDAAIGDNGGSPPSPGRAFQAFVSRFGQWRDTRGYVFTLNQDLLAERFYSSGKHADWDALMNAPGLDQYQLRVHDVVNATSATRWRITVPGDDAVETQKRKFEADRSKYIAYVKLHGSYRWFDSRGRGIMVIGHSKEKDVDAEPLLKWYHKLFQDVLYSGERILVAVGYGFGDHHINDVIHEAMDKHELRLYVVSPKQPQEFRTALEHVFAHRKDDPEASHH